MDAAGEPHDRARLVRRAEVGTLALVVLVALVMFVLQLGPPPLLLLPWLVAAGLGTHLLTAGISDDEPGSAAGDQRDRGEAESEAESL